MLYRASKFAHVFHHPSRNVAALWHALSMELFFSDASAADALMCSRTVPLSLDEIESVIPNGKGSKKRAVRALLASGFLVPASTDETRESLLLAEKLERARFIGVLYLMLHDGCNLRCTYCFENVREPTTFRPAAMPPEVAEAGLNLFGTLHRRYPPPAGHEPKVQLYGGEPLLNPRVFMHAASYFRHLQELGRIDERVGLATVTNGSFMNDQLAQFIVAHDISVGISLDGPKDLHNRHRVGKGPQDTYEAALRAFEMLRARGAKVGLSVTLTPEVVRDFDRVLAFLVDDLRADKGLGFNILHYTDNLELDAEYYDRAADCIIKAFKELRRRGIWEDRAMRKAVAFADKHPFHADCAAIGHQIVVSPDGKIGICQDFIKERRGFGYDVRNTSFDPFHDPDFVEWSTRTPLRMEECQACPALAICGGGCPASVDAATGSMWSLDRRICPHSLQTLEFLIWDTFELIEKTSH